METKSFQRNSPGRLIPTVGGARAFVPDPLPRSVPLEGSTVHLLADAEHALGVLTGVAGRLVNPFLLGSPLLRREAILSSRIEGTFTSAEELVLFEAGSPPGDERRQTDTLEVHNYIEAMRLGLARLKSLPVSVRLIRELHARLLKGVRGEDQRPGEFRDSQNYIGRKGQPIESARFVPPPVIEMAQALDHLERYIHLEPHDTPGGAGNASRENLSPLMIRLALLHYQFEAIHPFRDGNGRVGRLLIPLLLISHGRLREPLLYMSAYFERHREAYYDHLLRVSQTGEWSGWMNFFLAGVAESARESVSHADLLLALRARWQDQFQSARSSALLLKLIDHLFRQPSITIGRASALLRVTPAAASHNIRKLVNAGILRERTGRKRDQIFVASEILKVMDDSRGPRTR